MFELAWWDEWLGVDVVESRLDIGSLLVWLTVYASSLDELYLYSLCRLAGQEPQMPGMLRIIASVSERRDSRKEFVAEDPGFLRGVRGRWCGSMRVCARSGRLRVGVADERVG